MTPTDAPNLEQLQAELAEAGIAVPALGCTAGQVHTYDAAGSPAPLPPEAAAILAVHAARPSPHQEALAALRASDDPTIRHVLTLLGLA